MLMLLALTIKEEFQIRNYGGVRPAMLFILHYERNIICGSNIKKIYIYIYMIMN